MGFAMYRTRGVRNRWVESDLTSRLCVSWPPLAGKCHQLHQNDVHISLFLSLTQLLRQWQQKAYIIIHAFKMLSTKQWWCRYILVCSVEVQATEDLLVFRFWSTCSCTIMTSECNYHVHGSFKKGQTSDLSIVWKVQEQTIVFNRCNGPRNERHARKSWTWQLYASGESLGTINHMLFIIFCTRCKLV